MLKKAMNIALIVLLIIALFFFYNMIFNVPVDPYQIILLKIRFGVLTLLFHIVLIIRLKIK